MSPDSLATVLRQGSFSAALPGIFVHFLALTLIAAAVLLLNRTANATTDSRFLRHIAAAFAIMFFFRLGLIVVACSKALLAFQYLGYNLQASLEPAQAAKAEQTLGDVNSTWTAISLILSYLSTFWFLLAWWLLRSYPKQGIPRGFYVSAIGILSALVGLSAGIVNVANANAFKLLSIVDVLSSAGVIVMVGWELRKLAPKRGHPALAGVVFILYACWGLLQLPMLAFKIDTDTTYYMVLMVSGFAAMLVTVLHSSLVLEDKPEFKA